MTRRLISTGSPFEKVAGYSRAVVDSDWCWVAGTTGYDYAAMVMPESVADQTRNAMETIRKALADAGFDLADIVRANYIVADASYADIVFPIVGGYFSEIRPAATMIVASLIRPEMKVEIEVTAKKRSN
jgi:enamine deaminase RidA (YjgF/YER057c/UK114 family)